MNSAQLCAQQVLPFLSFPTFLFEVLRRYMIGHRMSHCILLNVDLNIFTGSAKATRLRCYFHPCDLLCAGCRQWQWARRRQLNPTTLR